MDKNNPTEKQIDVWGMIRRHWEMIQRENSQKGLKFIVKNCKDIFKL